MFNKIWVLIALTASTLSFSNAQVSNDFNFPLDKFDFGIVTEGDVATHTFEFFNAGKDTILLKAENVRASCGCTTPSFSTEPILPGQKGSITAAFNSQGRPGVFQKTITVYYKDQVAKMLNIKGIVEPKGPEAATPTEAELKKAPKLVLEKTTVNFGKVERGHNSLYSVKLSNPGKDTLFIQKAQAACSCANYKLVKEKSAEEVKFVLPGKSVTLQITYTPGTDGYNRDILTFYSNDIAHPRTSVVLESEVVESLQQKSIIQEGSNNAPFSNK
ncbi:MAG: DUF1573 domain-containing protein [Cytophaga sp.]|uniref:DUF1573 domain-containing protein n=1 Tax=Cytophaga sp. TaxID=29535 RepID=UPI003F7DC139